MTTSTRSPNAGRITGPVTGGRHGRPFGAFLGDPGEQGYVEEEYFLSGDARGFVPSGELGADGRWSVTAADSEPYTTRLLVRRPADPARFNGVVIAEWTNVTSGFELASDDLDLVYEEGFAHVAVSAQDIGVNGFAVDSKGLRDWDPERYGELSHPGDSHSYDIFSQAVHLIGPNRGTLEIDPLGGLPVRRVIASGGSQSAMRLVTYANAIAPLGHELDGILATLYVGSAYTFTDARVDASNLLNATPEELQAILGTPTGIREDVAVPFFLLNTECECVTYANVRQPDSARFHYWEVTGAAHAPAPSTAEIGAKAARDFGEFALGEGMIDPNVVPNVIDWRPVEEAALRHLVRWIEDGTEPPVQAPIRLTDQGAVDRDADGNGRDGLRLPELDAPIAGYDGGGVTPGTVGLSGQTSYFDEERLRALYPDHEAYVAAVTRAVDRCIADGVLLPEHRDRYLESAAAADVP